MAGTSSKCLTQDLWNIALERKRLIEPLLEGHYTHRNALAKQVAQQAGVSQTIVYQWVQQYRQTATLSALLPKTAFRGGKGSKRLLPEAEAIIADVLQNYFDTDQKPSITATVTEVRRLYSNAGLPLPAANTVRNRIARTETEERTKRRLGPGASHARQAVNKGSIPDAQWPLAMVQMDHTLLPTIIVDEKHRKPINRAWITLAIDVYSRVCLGMYLSLDAPSAMSAGMCIAHAMLPKEAWINKLGITHEHVAWPFYGQMGVLHMDNAREFRGDMLRFACQQYGIDIHLRPVKKPHYGAHIERLMGTVTESLKIVKGATFSSIVEKGEYDAEGHACMTMAEVEQWLVLMFARYHLQRHEGIGMSPQKKWMQRLLGTADQPGRGLPARRSDEATLRIHFTPYEERTVQAYGVMIDDVTYYHDVLRPWVNAPDPQSPKIKRKFRFHRDPRDISQIYFFDELSHRYVTIPYRDTSLPPVSIWELCKARSTARDRGATDASERMIFNIINEQRRLEEDAAQKTKRARRAVQQRSEQSKQRKQSQEVLKAVRKPVVPSTSEDTPALPPRRIPGFDPSKVQAFDDDDV